MAAGENRLTDRLQQPVCHGVGVGGAAYAIEQDRELIAAEPCDDFCWPQRRLNAPAHVLQYDVACRVAETVIH